MSSRFNNSDSGDAMHIGQAIKKLLNSYHLKSRFDEASLTGSWEKVVGKPVAKRTRRVFIKEKVLFVELESPAMKHDLQLHKEQILEIFQKQFGGDVIKEIVLL